MCGLTGFIDPGRRDGKLVAGILETMAGSLHHRGPDSGGVWTDGDLGVALGHRRLSIVDLSAEGHQPMLSESGRYVIVFNGEIYNFRAMRAELAAAGAAFRGHSDTEVLLAAIERFGLDGALERAAGMFALALWDRRDARLHLARDRVGKKPLYYGWSASTLVFGSELKAIAAHPDFRPTVNRDALTSYFRYQYVPAPHSIWQGVYKLPAGHRLTIDAQALHRIDREALPGQAVCYWSAKDVAETGAARPLVSNADQALDLLEQTLSQAVAERMVADVPLGAFLSGGIDSSLIVAMMQAQSRDRVKTFTIGFDEGFYDEAAAAREVALHLGTDHTAFTVTPQDALGVIPSLPMIYDEPFADPSAVPTALICRLARRAVTVCLSGDGGDEVFAGYGRYALATNLSERFERVPQWLRSLAGRGATAVPAGVWDVALRGVAGRAVPGLRGGITGDRIHKLASLMGADSRDALYHAMISLNRAPENLVQGGREPLSPFTDPAQATTLSDPLHRMMYRDTISYLPDDILVKVDRASMAASLEVRAPLLDHRVIEMAWRLPPQMLCADGRGKWPLRQLFDRYLPTRFRERPKQGFSVPIAEWLRGPLRDWAEDLFDPALMEADGLIDPAPVSRMWAEHLSGSRNWSAHLWTVAMFQSWRRQWLAEAAPAMGSALTDKAVAA